MFSRLPFCFELILSSGAFPSSFESANSFGFFFRFILFGSFGILLLFVMNLAGRSLELSLSLSLVKESGDLDYEFHKAEYRSDGAPPSSSASMFVSCTVSNGHCLLPTPAETILDALRMLFHSECLIARLLFTGYYH